MVETRNQQQSGQGLKVLIVDDDIPTRILLRAALNQWGYQIVEAGDGEEAWMILQSKDAPELLISDWIMPKLDGLGLCERIKKELSKPPYIILLTQMGGTANIIKGLEAGADEFLAKPFNMAELRSRLTVGARIVHYEQALEKTKSNTVESDLGIKSILTSLQTQIENAGGFMQEEKNNERTRIVIELPNSNEKR